MSYCQRCLGEGSSYTPVLGGVELFILYGPCLGVDDIYYYEYILLLCDGLPGPGLNYYLLLACRGLNEYIKFMN